MLDPQTALAAAARPLPRRMASSRRVLVAGGAGALGTAVLERLLAGHRFEQVGVLAAPTLNPALRRLQVVAPDTAALAAFAPDTALVVFDRARHANGREAAFVRPEPAALPALAAQLHTAGVRTLIVAVPHRAALLPAALKAGLASLDEAAVAGLGFDHLLFMRMAQAGGSGSVAAHWPQRLADGLLAQLHWMVPQQQQPVRTATVAQVAVRLALVLPAAAPGTRVLAPEWLWQAAQVEGATRDALLDAWLAGAEMPQRGRDERRW